MYDFGDRRSCKAVIPLRLLVVKHIFPQNRRKNTGKHSRNTAGKARVFSSAPICGEPTFNAAYNACDDAGGSAEKKPRTERRCIPCVYYCTVGFDAEFRPDNRKSSEQNACYDLPGGIRNFTYRFCALRKVYQSR